MTSELWDILVNFYYLYLVVTIFFLLLDNRETSATFAWMFVLIIFPVAGLILYLLIGRNRRKSHKSIRYQQNVSAHLNASLKEYMAQQQQNLEELSRKQGFPTRKKLFTLLSRNSHSLLIQKNSIKLFYFGKHKFDALINDLKNAKIFIHMEYFIWRSDAFTDQIKDILIAKAKAGVEVRILYDVIGSFFLKAGYIKDLRRAGVQIYPYDTANSVISLHSLNYRNHRKIVVIDGRVAYTGGMNMGQEYIDGGSRFEAWRDTHARIAGEAVSVLQSIFATSWYHTTREELVGAKYAPKLDDTFSYLPMQITISGPDSEWSSIEQLYFNLINSAQECICIQTPYFIPNESVYNSLLSAALGGVKVKIMITGTPDRFLPFWAAFSFFEPLLRAGAEIYLYEKGFLHAKTIIVDGEVSTLGTANMDIRSFQLNYEVNMLIYDKKTAGKLSDQFDKDLQVCRKFDWDEYEKTGVWEKFRNSVARLFAPLM